GVELADIPGTGPRGRVTLRDVELVAAAAGGPADPASNGHDGDREAPAAAPATPPGETLEPLSVMRRAVARRMTQSQLIPQFSLERDVDAAWLLGEKDRLKAASRGAAGGPAIGLNDLLLQAMAEMVLRHPALAASYVEGGDGEAPRLRRRDGVDVGLAVATPRGLLVPVVRGMHERPLAEVAAERARLVGLARSGRLAREEMGGAALTLSSLASFGVDRFRAMVNPGESCILAVGRVVDRAVPRGRGIDVVPSLSLTLTVDHRVADGAEAAAALAELAALLEGRMTWRP
ncbi:MAG: hypothetical protein AVDCRST_MAG13-700, partial [uncultured Solirubrobacteraceae bacterium]